MGLLRQIGYLSFSQILGRRFQLIYSSMICLYTQYRDIIILTVEVYLFDMSRIIVKNIPKVFTEKQVTEHFNKLDQITDCKIARDQQGKSRGFAFLGFKNTISASKAKKMMDNTYMGASKIRVDNAKLKNQQEEEQSRQRSRDQSKKGKDRGVKDRLEVFQSYKKMIEEKSKKSWDDLLVPKQRHFDEEQEEEVQTNNKGKNKLKNKPAPQKVEQIQQEPQVEQEKPIRTPRISQKNKKFVTKPLEIDSNRLYITNIPYNTTEQEVKTYFRRYGNIMKVKLPKQYDGRNKGYCFLTFDKSEQALRAFSECDNKVVFGRIIHIKPSLQDIGEMISTGKQTQYQQIIQEKYGDLLEEKTSFKKKKKRQMRQKYNDTTNWNTLFLNPNTVLERMAKKLHITKSQILVSENLAPKVALAEAEVIQETKNWMTENGISLDFLEKQRGLCERSNKIIIIKNLNFKTQESELRQLLQFYGIVERFLMAPNRAIAIAQFQSAQFADNALKSLQNHKFKNNYLFVEFAPIGMMDERTIDKQIEDRNQENQEIQQLSKVVYIKNLNFESVQADLYEILQKIGPVKYAKIVRNKDGKSMGFGFAEFESSDKAIEAVKKLNNCLLDGHKLLLSLSRKKAKNTEDIHKLKQKVKEEEQKSSKLMIRNIAFQATKNDIKQLFQQYGSLKKVRLPKKMDGSHRGFAFVEFQTAEEAGLARQVLGSAHLYGRKLVIEYEKGTG